MMSVSSGASKSMLSFTIYVGIGSKSHVLVVDVRTMRVMSFLVSGVESMDCACTPALDCRCSTTNCSMLESILRCMSDTLVVKIIRKFTPPSEHLDMLEPVAEPTTIGSL